MAALAPLVVPPPQARHSSHRLLIYLFAVQVAAAPTDEVLAWLREHRIRIAAARLDASGLATQARYAMDGLGLDMEKDFEPISKISSYMFFLVVHPSTQARSVQQLIALAKAKPGVLTYASAGIGSSNHLSGELLRVMAGINIVHVPYKGTAGQLTALLGNEVQMTFSTMPPAMPLVQAGRLRAIAIGSPKRSPALRSFAKRTSTGRNSFSMSGSLMTSFQSLLRRVPEAFPPSQT